MEKVYSMMRGGLGPREDEDPVLWDETARIFYGEEDMIPLFGKFFIFFALLVECFNGLVTYGDATFTLVWIIGEGADSGFSSVWVWRG